MDSERLLIIKKKMINQQFKFKARKSETVHTGKNSYY